MKNIASPLALGLLASMVSSHAATPLLSPSDFIIAINSNQSVSSFPAHEGPDKAIDGIEALAPNPDPTAGNKYLNFAGRGSGFIVTPAGGPSVIQSFTIATPNDGPQRDPGSYQIWGTNDAISSANNSYGNAENWTLISSGSLALPDARYTLSDAVSFANDTAYTSYKVVFPNMRGPWYDGRMQISEFNAYSGPGATGSELFSAADPVVGVNTEGYGRGYYPAGESPAKLIDQSPQDTDKYLHFGGAGSGVIVSPTFDDPTLTIVEEIVLMTANDAPNRTPTSYELYGTLDLSILSEEHSLGLDNTWVLIASGALDLGSERGVTSVIPIDNEDAYYSYKILFPTNGGDSLFQLAELQLNGSVIPEPGVTLLSGIALLGLGLRRRR